MLFYKLTTVLKLMMDAKERYGPYWSRKTASRNEKKWEENTVDDDCCLRILTRCVHMAQSDSEQFFLLVVPL